MPGKSGGKHSSSVRAITDTPDQLERTHRETAQALMRIESEKAKSTVKRTVLNDLFQERRR